ITTLHPSHLQPQDFMDLSNHTMSRVWVASHSASIFYYLSARHTRAAFPPDSRGFLYYHHDPSLPRTTAQIRFRLTPRDDPGLFAEGQDLVGKYGEPWAIDLLMLKQPFYEPFLTQLIRDGLVDPEFMRGVREGWKGHCRSSIDGPSVHYLEQPFKLDVALSDTVRMYTPHAIGLGYLADLLFRERRKNGGGRPYSGRILVRFERSTEPEHAGTRSLVIRVLKILEPIQPVTPGYDMYLPVPEEGQLLKKLGRGVVQPFSIDVDK
ncbi:hypothetical protein FPV67DRAFT_1375945, partial [Lyophyllum atratum]